MCGIAGFISKNRSDKSHTHEVDLLNRMNRCLSHRGPDSSGVWTNESQSVYLGHLRLAILDLSPTGNQPMHSHDERYVIVFNGEIYNFLELKAVLTSEGVQFRGTSDTEIFLEMIARLGVEVTLKKANGMFAFAL